MLNTCVDCKAEIGVRSTRCRSCSKKGNLNPIKKGTRCRDNYSKLSDEEIFKRRRCQNSRIYRESSLKWQELYDLVWVKSDGQCHYCKIKLNMFEKGGFQIDHKIPVRRGGSNSDIDNFAVACQFCNKTKSMMTEQEWFKCMEDIKQSGNWDDMYYHSKNIGNNQYDNSQCPAVLRPVGRDSRRRL